MWMIDALRHDFDVTVYTRGGFDLAELNLLAGTELSPKQIQVSFADCANAWPLGALAHGAYLHSLHAAGAKYDLRVTASGVAHWGRPAMHFISSALWNDALADKFDAPNARRRRNLAQAAASLCSTAISGERFRVLLDDCFIANSHWTAQQSAPFCPRPIEVVYPATPTPTRGMDWDEREAGVLVLGRVSPEKCIENCIEIVERLRAIGHQLRLNIIGPSGDSAYGAKIDSLCLERADWIERAPSVMGDDKQRLLGRFRYGLSACEVEAFGIATAEMNAAGLIVLAPESGAQKEILSDPLQLYCSIDEAVARFSRILDDDLVQSQLHDQAISRRNRFAPELFISSVRELADRFVAHEWTGGVEATESLT